MQGVFKSFRSRFYLVLAVPAIFAFGNFLFTLDRINLLYQIFDMNGELQVTTEEYLVYLDHTIKGVFLISSTAIIIIVFLVARLVRNLNMSMKEILSGTRKIGEGDLTHKINIESEDEFGVIAAFINGAVGLLDNSQKELNHLRTDFTAMLVHDLRTPLHNIDVALEYVSEKGVKKSEREEILDTTRKETKRLLGIVGDILDFSKIDSGKFDLQLAESNLTTIISEVVRNFEPASEKAGIKLKMVITGVKDFYFDEVRIRQVLTNLLSNAMKFTEDGEITIVLSETNNHMARVEVKDTGSGMSEEDIKSIFEKYVQVGNKTKRVQGTGLGLVVVKGIVEAHGGHVGVESKEGEGSMFWIEIPLDQKKLPEIGRHDDKEKKSS